MKKYKIQQAKPLPFLMKHVDYLHHRSKINFSDLKKIIQIFSVTSNSESPSALSAYTP
jgi:hypothetical protein